MKPKTEKRKMTRYKMRQVIRRFPDPKSGVPREEFECGHIRTDPMFHYGNETAKQVTRAFQEFSGTMPKGRCYKCGGAQ